MKNKNSISYPKTAVICNRKSGVKGKDASDEEAEFDSPETIEAICNALREHGVDAEAVEADENLPQNLKGYGFAFNLAEGRYGRDREAQVPAILAYLNIPFMGSDATAMAVSLDKDMCKRLVSSYGVRTASGAVLNSPEDIYKTDKLTFPLILKPNAEGSGKGIFEHSIAADKDELMLLLNEYFKVFENGLLVEEFLPGREFTVGLMGNGENVHVFKPMEVCYDKPEKYSVYNYEIKKDFLNYVHYECPAKLSPAEETELMSMAKTVFSALGCRDISRIDFRMNGKGEPCFMELNPLPGLAPDYSDYPMTAASEGISYPDTVFAVYKAAIDRVFKKEDAE